MVVVAVVVVVVVVVVVIVLLVIVSYAKRSTVRQIFATKDGQLPA